MARSVEIDPHSGFCGGVIRAITTAENYLAEHRDRTLYSLGSIVHNEEELARLESKGLRTITLDDLGKMVPSVMPSDASASGCGPVAAVEGSAGAAAVPGCGDTLLIRAHGEPPQTYARAAELGLEVVDCTCPVVLQLQKVIREAYAALSGRGKVIIFGKVGHAEVLGLVGQVGGDALVVENLEMLQAAFERGEVPCDEPVEVFSQTTKSPSEYTRTTEVLARAMATAAGDTVAHMLTLGVLHVHDTICAQVATRFKNLSDFALAHDVIIFVSGKTSSNGRVLCELCKSVNIRTYHIGSIEELKREWFGKDDKVGVCGATSTPKWLLEQVAQKIANL